MTLSSRALAARVAGVLVISAVAVPAGAHDRITTKVTWDREIAPIVHARCAGCHAPGSPIALTTYEAARPWAAAIKEEVLTRRMPDWNAARGYGAFANDRSLSPFEIALIAAWVDGGAPEREKPGTGDDRRAAIAPPPQPAAAPGPGRSRTVTLPCTEQSVSGRLLAVSPRLEKGGEAGIAARLPGGRQEIVAWIRNYDPRSPTVYWLRHPLTLPRGSRLLVEASGACSLQATFAR